MVARNYPGALPNRHTFPRNRPVLEATLDAIREALKNGDEVRLVGFGSFKVRKSAARKGVNPRDRQPIEVPAKERVRFTPGKELAEAVVKS